MDTTGYVDIFATKGIEYLLVIGFLAALIVFWRLLVAGGAGLGEGRLATAAASAVDWFRLPGDRFYHQGHLWAQPAEGGRVRIGLDDFAQSLLGKPDGVVLPRVGDRVRQGASDIGLRIDSRDVDLLSPLDGEVRAVNERVVGSPELVNRDPYGEGWLVELDAPQWRANRTGLLSGALARSWMEQTVGDLRLQMSGRLGTVLQDGGVPVSGIARQLSPTEWDAVVREFLRTA